MSGSLSVRLALIARAQAWERLQELDAEVLSSPCYRVLCLRDRAWLRVCYWERQVRACRRAA